MEIWPSTSINILSIVTCQGKENKGTFIQCVYLCVYTHICYTAPLPRSYMSTKAPPHGYIINGKQKV